MELDCSNGIPKAYKGTPRGDVRTKCEANKIKWIRKNPHRKEYVYVFRIITNILHIRFTRSKPFSPAVNRKEIMMSYTFSFSDNEQYGAANLNAVTARLVTSGVADSFKDGVPYNLSALNNLGTLLYTEGVVPESADNLRVTLTEGEIHIAPGTAFFQDGAVMEITVGGHTLPYTPDTELFVYLYNDLKKSNRCYPAAEPTMPEGDFVLLAKISADGTVSDKRVYAKGKLPGYASSAMYTVKIEDEVKLIDGKPESKTYILDGNYSHLLAVKRGTVGDYKERFNFCVGIYSFAQDDYISCDYADGNNCGLSVEKLTVYRSGNVSAHATVTQTAVGDKAAIRLDFECYHSGTTAPRSFPVTLYLF